MAEAAEIVALLLSLARVSAAEAVEVCTPERVPALEQVEGYSLLPSPRGAHASANPAFVRADEAGSQALRLQSPQAALAQRRPE